MIKIGNPRHYQLIAEGELASFEGVKPRDVVMQVNAPKRVELHIVYGGEPTFLATVEGRDTLQFWVDGPFEITPDGGDVYVSTSDGAKIHLEDIGEATFTRIVERRRVSPEVALMERTMQINIRRMMEIQQTEMERRLAAHENNRSSGSAAGSSDAQEPVASKPGSASTDGSTPPVVEGSNG